MVSPMLEPRRSLTAAKGSKLPGCGRLTGNPHLTRSPSVLDRLLSEGLEEKNPKMKKGGIDGV